MENGSSIKLSVKNKNRRKHMLSGEKYGLSRGKHKTIFLRWWLCRNESLVIPLLK